MITSLLQVVNTVDASGLSGLFVQKLAARCFNNFRQLEADILTISRGNSILVLSCFFKVSKYISECRPR